VVAHAESPMLSPDELSHDKRHKKEITVNPVTRGGSGIPAIVSAEAHGRTRGSGLRLLRV